MTTVSSQLGPPPDAPRYAEAPAVQLTRIEGVLALIFERLANQGTVIADALTRIATIEQEISLLKSGHQTLSEQAVARDATALALASALKAAEDNRRAQTDQRWTPFSRVIVVLGGILTLATLWIIGTTALGK